METFRMPDVQIGDTVLWYPDANQSHDDTPSPAIVTRVSERTISVSVVGEGIPGLNCYDGVRHISDPSLRRAEIRANGGWDYLPRQKEQQKKKAG